MMHSMSFVIPPKAPSIVSAYIIGNGSKRKAVLTWANNSINATSITIQRAASSSGTWSDLVTLPSNSNLYTDVIGNKNNNYYYRIFASNTVGDTGTPGFPTVTMNSDYSNIVNSAEMIPLV